MLNKTTLGYLPTFLASLKNNYPSLANVSLDS